MHSTQFTITAAAVSRHERFTLDANSKGTRARSCKLVKTWYTKDISKYFFSNTVINRWNLLDQQTLDASGINAFKSKKVSHARLPSVEFRSWSRFSAVSLQVM